MTSDDFIPLTTSTNNISDSDNATPSSSDDLVSATASPNSLAERLKMARLTMEGPERAIERERNEKEEHNNQEHKKLQSQLALVLKHKEDLEIAWVVLDNKKNDLKKLLAPILAEEEKSELAEAELESREQTTLIPSDRQKIEKERWQAQEGRRKIEVKKWELEDKVAFLENQIKENTTKYQALLDDEEKIRQALSGLEEELNILAEQIRIEEEDKRQKALIEAEARQKELQLKKATEAKITAPRPAESVKKIEVKTETASTVPEITDAVKPATSSTVKSREDLMREAEENRKKMQAEIARITGNLAGQPGAQPATPAVISIPPTPSTKKEGTEPLPITINVIKQAPPAVPTTPSETISTEKTNYLETITPADLDLKTKEKNETPVPSSPLEATSTRPSETTQIATAMPATNQNSSLPRLRTLQSDLEKMKNQSTSNN